MSNDIAISVEGISKKFKIPYDKQTGLKGTFINILLGKNKYRTFYPLKNIGFDIKKGEFVGIIGRNGSGKSTLLKIIAGILEPTSGTIKVNGKFAPILELGFGFQDELTGKENVYLYGSILGLTKEKIDQKYNQIITFAELSKFMNMKLKNYSSGMMARLAFSISIHSDADIFLFDEALAVGDVEFQEKCYSIFENFIRQKKTILLASHDLHMVRRFSNKIILLDNNSNFQISREVDKIVDQYVNTKTN